MVKKIWMINDVFLFILNGKGKGKGKEVLEGEV